MSANIEQAPVDVAKTPQAIIYGHSRLFYWWPVWVLGDVMGWLTWLHPVGVQVGDFSVLVSSSTILGVIYALVTLLTILITNTKMRGVTSLVVVLVIGFLTLLLAYLDWWPDLLAWFATRTVFLVLGFYLFFAAGLLLRCV